MSVVVVVALALITSLAAFARAWLDHRELQGKLVSIKRQTAELQQKLSRRGQLASEIAHEIKNPITAIQCSAQTLDLMLGGDINPELRKSIRYISEYSDYLLRLLTDFLEVSRCEAGVNHPQPEIFQLNEAIDSVIGLLKSYAFKKHINLSATPIPADVRAWADQRHIKQILFNLVHNSLKFTPEYGAIEIDASWSAQDRCIEISVRDTGWGIPAEQLSTIFDPYARYEAHQPKVDAGVGLGLALCGNLVELNGGKISVKSTVGRGSTFTFTVPKAQAITLVKPSAVALPPPPSSALYQPLLGQSFLLVDNDSSTRDSIAKLIQAWGGMVDQVAQATDALEAIGAKSYDAVMVDNTRDGLNGYELASLLRDNAHSNGTTIILATKSTPDEELAHACGADQTIEKPLKGDLLLQSLLTAGKCQMTH